MILLSKIIPDYCKYLFFGGILALSNAPFNFYPIFFLSFAWLLQKSLSDKFTLKNGFLFFFSMHVFNLLWIIHPLSIEIEKHFFLIPIALIVIPGFFSLLLSTSFFIQKKINKKICKLLIFSVSFSIIIYLYGHSKFGFPWIMPSYFISNSDVLLQSVSIYGVYGLNFILLIIASNIAYAYILFEKKKKLKAIKFSLFFVFSMIILIFFGYSKLNRIQENTNLKARIVQGNIPQEINFYEGKLEKYIDLSSSPGDVDILIWPEATIPFLSYEDYKKTRKIISSISKGKYFISGAIRKDLTSEEVYNSIVILNDNGDHLYSYDKMHLVPFGEYIPFRKILKFSNITNDIEDFSVGKFNGNISFCGLNINLVICYEAIFPMDFFHNELEKKSDLIINITNDGWFQNTNQPFQHLQIVKVRAIEMGMPLIRVTNYGISAVFDDCGREIHRIDFNKSGYLDFYIPKKNPQQTPYSKYGDSIFFIMIIMSVLFIIWAQKTKIISED